jgi:hypothetical protein
METMIPGVEINIRKARITRIGISFNENDLPDVSVDLDLLTASGKKITSVDLSTSAWNDNCKIPETEVDHMVYSAIADIVHKMLPVAIRKINGIEKLLGSEKTETVSEGV